MEQINLHNAIIEQQYCSKVGVGLRLNGERSSVRFSFSRNGFVEFFRIKGSDINIIVNGTTHVLNPMKPTLISVSNDVLISRPKGAKGHILVSKLFLEDVVLEEVVEAPTFVSNDIDLFLRKIGRASGINKTDFGIFASELAEIDNEADILDLQTDPPNGWVRKGNKIVFIYPCRIFDVIMNTNAVINNHVPNDIIVASRVQAEREDLNQAVQKTVENNIKNKKRAMSEIVIDSSVDVLASSLEKCNKVAGGIVMSSMGKFIIPLALLEPNTAYNVSLSSRIINGNGRLGLQLTSNSGTIYQNIIGNNNICVDICSGSIGFGETYFLNVYRPAKMSTGSLLINNIRITKTNSPNYNYDIQKVSNNYIADNKIISIDVKNESVENVFRNFAILFQNKNETETINDIEETFNISGISSKFWLNKIQETYPNIKNGESNISICDIDNIIDVERVWINEFVSVPNFVLSKTEIIFTPSLINKIQLQNLFPQKQIRLLGRPWPKLNIQKKEQDYILYFEKNREMTKHLFEIYESDLKLHVVGTRMKLPKYASYISEYDSYSNIYKELCGAKILIDFSENKHYQSGIINLALDIGIPVITNNHAYINKALVVRNSLDEPISKKSFISILNSEKIMYNCECMSVSNFIQELKS
jgi:hypothetical protein